MGTTQVQQIRLQQQMFRPIALIAVDFRGHFIVRDRDKDMRDNHLLYEYFAVVRLNCKFFR